MAEKKPAMLFQFINKFHDDIETSLDTQNTSLDTQNKHSQEQLEKQDISQSTERKQEKKERNQEKEVKLNKDFSETVKALKSQISEQAPEFEKQITTHQEQIQNEYGLNTDQAYLLAVAELYSNNRVFQAKVQLDKSTL
jgi:gas vesicle protein